MTSAGEEVWSATWRGGEFLRVVEGGFDEGDPVGFIETLRVETAGAGLP